MLNVRKKSKYRFGIERITNVTRIGKEKHTLNKKKINRTIKGKRKLLPLERRLGAFIHQLGPILDLHAGPAGSRRARAAVLIDHARPAARLRSPAHLRRAPRARGVAVANAVAVALRAARAFALATDAHCAVRERVRAALGVGGAGVSAELALRALSVHAVAAPTVARTVAVGRGGAGLAAGELARELGDAWARRAHRARRAAVCRHAARGAALPTVDANSRSHAASLAERARRVVAVAVVRAGSVAGLGRCDGYEGGNAENELHHHDFSFADSFSKRNIYSFHLL